MSLTLNIYDENEDVVDTPNRIHIGEYILEEENDRIRNGVHFMVMKKNGDDIEKLVSGQRGLKFYVDYSKKTGKMKMMVGETSYLFIKSGGMFLFKDRLKELCGNWDILRGEYLVGMKGIKKSLYVLDIFYQNEYEFNFGKLDDFRDILLKDIRYTFQWNKYKNRIDFFIYNVVNRKLNKIILEVKDGRWVKRDESAIGFDDVIDLYLYNDKLIIFTEKGIFDTNTGDWVMNSPIDYKLLVVYKTNNSNIIWLLFEYKTRDFGLKQLYVFNAVGDYYHRIEINIDFFYFNAFFMRNQWICRFESPIGPPILVSELYNKKTFYIPLGSSKVGRNYEYEEKKDYIEYKRGRIKYILFKRKNLSSNVFIILSLNHLGKLRYRDELFEKIEANEKMIYPSYIFTKSQWIEKVADHFRIMYNLRPNQILIELMEYDEKKIVKLTETVEYFLLNDECGSVCKYNLGINDFERKYFLYDGDNLYNSLLDIFIKNKK